MDRRIFTRTAIMGAFLLASMAQAKRVDPVIQARQLYNDERYDDAILVATDARAVPAAAARAAIVLARAHLERFRITSDPADLPAARTALKTIDAARLAPLDRVELAIAVGESLYLDDASGFRDRYSAAAEQFEEALAQADLLDARSRDLLFEWWAISLDHQAQQGSEGGRRALYERIVTRAASEVGKAEGATSAAYWLAAGARGIGDVPRAAGAAAAGWVRAAALGVHGAALRVDLDRLMRQVILPERALQLAPNLDARPLLTTLQQQWEQLKTQWDQEPAKE